MLRTRLAAGIGPWAAVTVVTALQAAVWLVGRDHPEAFLPLAAVVVCLLAAGPRAGVRLTAQAVVVAGMAASLLAAGRDPFDALVALAVLVGVASLADALAGDLVAARRAEAQARAGAVARGELLRAVRDLPNSDLGRSARAAATTLRQLGFDAAGVAVTRRDGQDLQLFLDGIPDPPAGQQTAENGVVGRALREDRTIVVADYQADPDRLEFRPDVGSAVVVPIRVGGRAVGVLMGTRRAVGSPAATEVEVAEVVAAHLGLVIGSDEQLRRQRELLARRRQLDEMRMTFVTEVSDELRHPLTVVRGIGETLRARDLDRLHREDLLQRMATHTEQLSATIDALLNVAGVYASRLEPKPEIVPVDELLAPVATTTGVVLEAVPDVAVEVDVHLVRHGLELLLSRRPRAGDHVLEFRVGPEGVVVRSARAQAAHHSAIMQRLATQLLVLGGATVGEAVTVVTLPLPADYQATARHGQAAS